MPPGAPSHLIQINAADLPDVVSGGPMFKNPLARDVAVVLAVKTAIVLAAAFFVFGPAQRPAIDAGAVQRLIASPTVSSSQESRP
jgi:hypothetical protein